MKDKVLVVGRDARAHAIIWKLRQSPDVDPNGIYHAPGFKVPGIAVPVPIPADHGEELADFAKAEDIALTVVSSEEPLAAGIVDEFSHRGRRIVGPTRAAARIESSKAFAKVLMKERGVPTADFEVFSDHREALDYIRSQNRRLVVKADGLSSGKGVYVCSNLAMQEEALHRLMVEEVQKEAGATVVIEEFLEGEEVSVFAACAGTEFQMLTTVKDHKKIRRTDEKNTGGMGGYSPVPSAEKALYSIGETIFRPTLEALAEAGTPFTGFLFAGLMNTKKGLHVLEFNCRLGDPEAQSLLPRLTTDFYQLLSAVSDGKPKSVEALFTPCFTVSVVLAAPGYPEEAKIGARIGGIPGAQKMPGVEVFFGAIARRNGEYYTDGGRPLTITALDASGARAGKMAYQAADLVFFPGKQFREDMDRDLAAT